MPMVNFHSARILNPAQCPGFSYKKTQKGVDFVLCWKGGKSSIQSVRFDKKKFTSSEAKKWLEDHNIDYSNFEEAKLGESFMTFKDYLEEKNISKSSNWKEIGFFFDIDIEELNDFARNMGYDNFEELDMSISPADLYKQDKNKFYRELIKVIPEGSTIKGFTKDDLENTIKKLGKLKF